MRLCNEILENVRMMYDNALLISNGQTEHPIWENVYDNVFSSKISKRLFEEYPDFEYADPDTSYYEDVAAFLYALEAYIEDRKT